MRRLFWIAVGAAGGIYAYRRGQEYIAQAKENGVVLTAQQAGAAAVTAVAAARSLTPSQVVDNVRGSVRGQR